MFSSVKFIEDTESFLSAFWPASLVKGFLESQSEWLVSLDFNWIFSDELVF